MQQTEEEIHYRGVDLDYITTFADLLRQLRRIARVTRESKNELDYIPPISAITSGLAEYRSILRRRFNVTT